MSSGFNQPWAAGDTAHAFGINAPVTLEVFLAAGLEESVGAGWWKVKYDGYTDSGERKVQHNWVPVGALSAKPWTAKPAPKGPSNGVYLVQQIHRADVNPTVRRLEDGKWFFVTANEGLPAGDPCDAPVRIIQRLQD